MEHRSETIGRSKFTATSLGSKRADSLAISAPNNSLVPSEYLARFSFVEISSGIDFAHEIYLKWRPLKYFFLRKVCLIIERNSLYLSSNLYTIR